jgi:hypothetical protein
MFPIRSNTNLLGLVAFPRNSSTKESSKEKEMRKGESGWAVDGREEGRERLSVCWADAPVAVVSRRGTRRGSMIAGYRAADVERQEGS